MPLDPYGRLLSLPPNSAANAHFLSMLRHLLIQECDLNDDGKPETLRLGFATPQRWLMDGKGYSIENAPTAFGRLSARVSARLERNEVFAELDLPQRNPPEKTWFRVRVPNGWQVKSGKCGGKSFKCDNQGTFDLSGLAGKQTLEVHVTRKK